MPLYELYSKQMESRIADINNLGTPSRAAGSCTAAAFLKVSLKFEYRHIYTCEAYASYCNKFLRLFDFVKIKNFRLTFVAILHIIRRHLLSVMSGVILISLV